MLDAEGWVPGVPLGSGVVQGLAFGWPVLEGVVPLLEVLKQQ